jgi:hypothetical protein
MSSLGRRIRPYVIRAWQEPIVTRNNILYLIIGALVIVAAALGYQLYQDRHQPPGVHIDLGPNGLSIQNK